MEKITIKEISEELKTKTGDSFWGVVLNDDRKATVWDAQIAADIKLNLNYPTNAELIQKGSFLNIREFNAERKALVTPKATETTQQTETEREKQPAQVTNIDPSQTFEFEAKSSVKLKKNSKGMGWEIKVVRGEENLIMGLMEAATTAHKALEMDFPEVIKA